MEGLTAKHLTVQLGRQPQTSPEACDSFMADIIKQADTGQITVFGTGSKIRHILLPADTWRKLEANRR